LPNPEGSVEMGEKELWYQWGADKAGFESRDNFLKFCDYAGVDPTEGVQWCRWKGASYGMDKPFCFVSRDKKVSFVCSNDPRASDDAYVHYFGCNGLRSRVQRLEAWFKDNGEWDEICHGGRDFC
ncbi:MAG: hypothetical protein AAF242_02510, partial [Bacteroidota bacterium]